MTTEEKARIYDEALEKAKSWYVDDQIYFKKTSEALFPVLKKPEAEKNYYTDDRGEENPLREPILGFLSEETKGLKS